MNPEPAEVLDLSPAIDTSSQKKQRSNDVPKTVEVSNYEVSSPEASDTNTIENVSNMNPEPAEVLNLSPVIEGNASIELSPGISEKEYDFFIFYISLYITFKIFLCKLSMKLRIYLLEIIPFSVYHVIIRPNHRDLD